jgi:hypothetical protein
VNLRWRTVLGGLEVDELAPAVSSVRPEHQIDPVELVPLLGEVVPYPFSHRFAKQLHGYGTLKRKVEGTAW